MSSLKFLIFFSSTNSPRLAVHRYHTRAAARARQTGKMVSITDVDIDVATATQREHWSGAATIEYVTVRGNQRLDAAVNPTLSGIDQLIDNL